MYGNMTREEMIQRLYEGNFTTGELERQLVAKLFEQCCGGGGSSGGETLVVEIESTDDGDKFNKTAKEVFDACKTSNVIFVQTDTEMSPAGLVTGTYIYGLTAIELITDGSHSNYVFKLSNVEGTHNYVGQGDNSYPQIRK